MTDYLNFMFSTCFKIIFYYKGVQQSQRFDDIFIVSNRVSMERFKEIVKIKVDLGKDDIEDSLPYIDRELITYKIQKNEFFLNNDFWDVADYYY